MLKLLCLFIFCTLAFATPGGSACVGTASCTPNEPHLCRPSYTNIAVEPIPTGRSVLQVSSAPKSTTGKIEKIQKAPKTGVQRKVLVTCLARGCGGNMNQCYTPIFTINIDFQTEMFLRSICPTTVQNCLCSDVINQLSGTSNAFSVILTQNISQKCPRAGSVDGNSHSSSLLEFTNKVLQEAEALESELESYE
jgi:hypothetical protein